MTTADFTLIGKPGDTVYLLRPETASAEQWLQENFAHDGDALFHGRSLAIEHRYVGEFIDQLEAEGWSVDV